MDTMSYERERTSRQEIQIDTSHCTGATSHKHTHTHTPWGCVAVLLRASAGKTTAARSSSLEAVIFCGIINVDNRMLHSVIKH